MIEKAKRRRRFGRLAGMLAAGVLAVGAVGLGATAGAAGAATATVWVSTNLTTWQVLQSVPVVNGAGVVTDITATNLPVRFYRLSLP